MKIIPILAVLFSLLLFPKNIFAQRVAGTSASLSNGKGSYVHELDYRVYILNNFLSKHKSPLAQHSREIIWYADLYNIDWRLLPAISGVESTFGKRIPSNSYNAYGWANGKYYFDSWEDSIETVTKTLREKYYDSGANTIHKISLIYAPPSKTWAWKVNYFMNQIDPLPLYFNLDS